MAAVRAFAPTLNVRRAGRKRSMRKTARRSNRATTKRGRLCNISLFKAIQKNSPYYTDPLFHTKRTRRGPPPGYLTAGDFFSSTGVKTESWVETGFGRHISVSHSGPTILIYKIIIFIQKSNQKSEPKFPNKKLSKFEVPNKNEFLLLDLLQTPCDARWRYIDQGSPQSFERASGRLLYTYYTYNTKLVHTRAPQDTLPSVRVCKCTLSCPGRAMLLCRRLPLRHQWRSCARALSTAFSVLDQYAQSKITPVCLQEFTDWGTMQCLDCITDSSY